MGLGDRKLSFSGDIIPWEAEKATKGDKVATTVPKRVANRISSALKKFQPILQSALDRDVNESDTVDIMTDMLDEIFGYDKYVEVTSEYKIRGTYCDLAIEIDGRIRLLIEVKAIGIELKENHLRQAVNYAANEGVDWVVLTNGINWQVYRVTFTKPIKKELVVDFDLLDLSPRKPDEMEPLFLLSREGLAQSALPDYFARKQATSRYVIGAILLSDPLLKSVRRELKKVSPDIKFDIDHIKGVVEREVLKREVVEGEKATEARKRVEKAAKATQTRKKPKEKPIKKHEPSAGEPSSGADVIEMGEAREEKRW